MSFSYKTENLGLPIWGSSDKPTQDDLNFQNQKIDNLITEDKLNNFLNYITDKIHQVETYNFNIDEDVNGDAICLISIPKDNNLHVTFNNIASSTCLDGIITETFLTSDNFGFSIVPFDYVQFNDKVRMGFTFGYYE